MKKFKLYFWIAVLCFLWTGLSGCGRKGTALYFIVNGSLYETEYLAEAGTITLPTLEAQPGYEFKGWYWNDELLTNTTFSQVVPSQSINIYAKMEAITYTLNFMTDGGILPEEEYYYAYSELEYTLPIPTKAGYTFLGWSRADRNPDVLYTTIPGGTYGDLSYQAHWELGTFTINFDTRGGETLEPICQEAFTSVSLPTPTKDKCTFRAWYTSLDFSEEVTNSIILDSDMTLYAAWESQDNYLLTYSTNIENLNDVITSNKANDELVCSEEDVYLEALYYAGGYVFTGWYSGNTCLTLNPYLAFTMSQKTSLLAHYTTLNNTFTVDLNAAKDLIITLNNVSSQAELIGSDFTTSDYSMQDNILTIKYEALARQDLGYLSLYLDTTPLMINIMSSAEKAYHLDIDYDRNYPEVCLNFSGNGQYEVSLNGSGYVSAYSGMILKSYDKAKTNSVTLREKTTLEETTITKVAYTALNQTYYNSSFTFSGNTYDYVFDSLEELSIFMKYVTMVAAPLYAIPNATYPYGSYEAKGWCSEAILVNNSDDLFIDLFNDFSTSCAMSMSYRGGTYNAPVANIVINLLSNLNTDSSSQVSQDLVDRQQALTVCTHTRTHLPIDYAAKTQNIVTLYELENLSTDIVPVISDTSSQAYAVYQKARSICSKYISEDMNDFEKVTAFYNYLALNVTYDNVVAQYDTLEGGNYTSFTSYGALVEHKAVCDGIASALVILCLIEQIPCIEVVGSYENSGHAWNKVYINKAWWGVDATWARTENYINHAYLFMNEATLKATGHEESSYTSITSTTIANGFVNYYQLMSTNYSGHSLYVASSDDLVSALQYAQSRDMSVLEIAYAGSNFNFNINVAIALTGIKIIGSSHAQIAGLNYLVYYIRLK